LINLLKKLSILVVIFSLITIGSLQWSERLSFTGISMLYLLLVVAVAYHLSTEISAVLAITSFFVLNYFFVEPRFTFQVAHIASWASLISFLIVSIVITSLVKRLKLETIKSNDAYLRADLLRQLAEKLALAEQPMQVLVDSQDWLQNLLGQPIYIIHNQRIVKGDYALSTEQLNAILWVQANGKQLGASTENWPDADDWIAPLNRLPSVDPVVFIPKLHFSVSLDTLESIKLAIGQISATYQQLVQREKVRLVEHQAHEESIKSTLLASIAHDMRTPLTSILGAATTLNQSEISFSANEMQHLTTIISSQAKHLASTTENILSLVRLESVSKESIAMDIQSPEEIVGILADLYQYQTNVTQLSIVVNQPDLLIKANGELVLLALTNLIENAKQANIENNQPNAKIQIIVDALDGKVFIRVCDNGCGFPDGFSVSQIKKFESSRDKGFGLGLSIVEAVANLHHATLIFSKGINNGAVVSLCFNKLEVDLAHVG
jgi:two-component system sensor histidine kinase KdpD